MENKKIKIELTLKELDVIINDIDYWVNEHDSTYGEDELLKKLEQIKKENEKNKNNGNKILDLIEKDELTQDEYYELVDWIDMQIDFDDKLHDFYEVVLRIEKYEKEGK